MILRMFAIYDSKACAFGQPHVALTDSEAVRSFLDITSDRETSYGRHPEDYDLWFIGEFDTATSLLTPATKILRIFSPQNI
ncbi:MAG: nonstructural protein [Microvirus sp.]|nr:MAG: nonstructural protein [Microvirus sp.]